jgi:peptide deformylase
MEIVRYPHPALRWKSKPIQQITQQLRDTVREMFELMYAAKGIGLAANQVALPYRLFVINPTGDADETDQEHVFLNPEIIRRKGSVEGEEGCLSLPDLYGSVPRADQIVVSAFDLSGQEFEMTLSELPSLVIQHENDHLDGVLFIDRVNEPTLRDLLPHLEDLEQQFRRDQKAGTIANNEVLEKRLKSLEPRQPGN